jgi:hypothetical protein
MDFKNHFQAVLRAGVSYPSLMELVHRHRAKGLSVDAAYDALHQIWLEHGFDEAESGNLQDTLEAVLEKVWYGHPVV